MPLLSDEGIIPDTVQGRLERFGYKIEVRAKDFIVELCSKNDAMDWDFQEAPMKIRGGVMKNHLAQYVERATESMITKECVDHAD